MKQPRLTVLLTLLFTLTLQVLGGSAAASHMELSLGFLPEVTAESVLLVRGIFTPGADVEISLNEKVVAAWKPSGNIYRAQINLESGPNHVLVKGSLDGETVIREARIFRTTATFTDLIGHWARTDAEMLATLGIVSGIAEATFGPGLDVNRAQFAKMVVLALGIQTDPAAALAFADAEAIPQWAHPYVAAAVGQGLITGFEDNTFRADLAVSRAQIAVIVGRGLRLRDFKPTGEPHQFTDQADLPLWAAADIALSTQAGILSGYDDGRFLPARTATRAEAAAIVRRLWQVGRN